MRTTATTINLIFFALLFSFQPAVADIILNPQGTDIRQRILSSGAYTDIRIDSDLDGKIDQWFLQNGNTQILTSFERGSIQNIEIVEYRNNNFYKKVYQRSGRKLVQIRNESRPMKLMFGEAGPCDNTQLLNSKITDLVGDLKVITTSKGSCDFAQLPKFSENLKKIIANASSNVKVPECLAKQEKAAGFDLLLISAKLKAILSKLNTPDKNQLVTCAAKESGNLQGITSENGKIRFAVPINSEDPVVTQVELRKLLFHELLHASGIDKEGVAKSIAEMCLSEGSIDPKKIVNNGFDSDPATMADATSNSLALSSSANTKDTAARKAVINKSPSRGIASAAAKSGDGIDMKSEIANAEAIIPSAEKLNVAKVDKSPEGKEKALKDSARESAPVFRMANQVMGASNTPALAESGNDSDSSSSSGSGSGYASSDDASSRSRSASRSDSDRELGSSKSSSKGERYQSRYGRYQSSSSSSSKYTSVGPDEEVVEEIDLTKNQNSKTATRSPQAARQPSSYQNETKAAQDSSANTNKREPASVSNEIAASKRRPAGNMASGDDSANFNGGGGGGSSADLSMNTSGLGNNSASTSQRNQNSRSGSSSRAPASISQTAPTQRQIMTDIVERPYNETKSQLNSREYQSTLVANKISIVNTYGGRWGSKEPTIIYLDDGQSFKRQR